MTSFQREMLPLLSAAERRLFKRLSSPQRVQDYLDSLPINFEIEKETYLSPRNVIREQTAHCFEGALLAAAALAFNGKRPLILDLKTIPRDEDHVVALFKENGRWGAISKTNHAVLRYRDPIYKTIRELALSYAHEYTNPKGKKTMRSYSAPFDLSRYYARDWVITEEDLFWLVDDLDVSRHFPLASEKILKKMRPATKFETQTLAAEEWQNPLKRRGAR